MMFSELVMASFEVICENLYEGSEEKHNVQCLGQYLISGYPRYVVGILHIGLKCFCNVQ